ncbi:MAG: GTP cyclohydrolase I FolE2 [Calditrichaeota bacterium]|nr:MAG: GTP cyclohydrolase I FolE2 [Calditrichota bacterium]
MVDVQNRPDERGIPINKVGVKQLKYPIVVLDRAHEKQQTVAEVSLSVSLPHHFKGTHMSRFVEVLNEHHDEMTMWTLPTILHKLKERLDAESAHVEFTFPYFIEKRAPVSKAIGLMDYQTTFIGETYSDRDIFILKVNVPVTSLCPCSKEISDYGAHNQRGEVTIEVQCKENEMIWIEEVVEIAESSASAPVYALLKRPDERFVTMQAYDNPAFVEDIVRNVALQLKADERVVWFRVHAENFESIHNHNAFAMVEWRREN